MAERLLGKTFQSAPQFHLYEVLSSKQYASTSVRYFFPSQKKNPKHTEHFWNIYIKT